MISTSARRSQRKFSTRFASALCGASLFLVAAACDRGRWNGVLDPANELPFGAVDAPLPNAQVKAMHPISGWALDDRGVREIRVYVDGHIVSHGGLDGQRPDISALYPRYAGRTHLHGWTLLMGFEAPGRHSVVVQAVDTDGASRDIGAFTVTSIDQ